MHGETQKIRLTRFIAVVWSRAYNISEVLPVLLSTK